MKKMIIIAGAFLSFMLFSTQTLGEDQLPLCKVKHETITGEVAKCFRYMTHGTVYCNSWKSVNDTYQIYSLFISGDQVSFSETLADIRETARKWLTTAIVRSIINKLFLPRAH